MAVDRSKLAQKYSSKNRFTPDRTALAQKYAEKKSGDIPEFMKNKDVKITPYTGAEKFGKLLDNKVKEEEENKKKADEALKAHKKKVASEMKNIIERSAKNFSADNTVKYKPADSSVKLPVTVTSNKKDSPDYIENPNALKTAKAEDTNKSTKAKTGGFFPSAVIPSTNPMKFALEKEKEVLAKDAENALAYENKLITTARKYGYNPETFNHEDLDEWATKYNLEYVYGDGNTAGYYKSKKEGDILGFGGKKLASEETEKDLIYLESLAAQNNNKKFAKEYPVISSAATVVTAPIREVGSALAVTDDFLKTAQGKEINLFSSFRAPSNTTNVIRETVDKEYASKAFGGYEAPVIGNVGSFLYNTGMSAGDSAVTLLTTKALLGGISDPTKARKAISTVTSGLMSSDAAANAVVENKKKGYSDERSLFLGISSGLIEMATEKYSIDQILKEPKSILSGVIKGAIAEGSEETVAEASNILLDIIANKSNSDFSKSIEYYKFEGLSEKDALMHTLADSGFQVLAAGLGGMLSGAPMSLSSQAGTHLNKMQTAASLGLTTKEYDAFNSTDEKIFDKNMKKSSLSDLARPVIEINKKLTELRKQGKENTDEFKNLMEEKKKIWKDFSNTKRENSIQKEKYGKLSSDPAKLKALYPHASDENINELSELVSAVDVWNKNEKNILDRSSDAFSLYEQHASRLHELVDELSYTERTYKYKDVKFASVEDSAKISDSDAELFHALSEKFGTKFVVDSTIINDGMYDNGTIYINPNSKSIHQNVFAHELVHHGEKSQQYNDFKNEILRSERIKSWAKYKNYSFDSLKSLYKEAYKREYDIKDEAELNELIEREIVADYVADILTQDVSYLHRMVKEDTLSGKILSYIRDFFVNIADMLHISTPESRYARDIANKLTAVLDTVDENFDNYDTARYKISGITAGNPKNTELINVLNDNINIIENTEDIFNISVNKKHTVGNASDFVLKYFDSIGNEAYNPVLGVVELNKAGAKSTVFHGIGKEKISAVLTVRDVIEKGIIINKEENWKNRGYNTIVIAGKGIFNGNQSVVGVIVKEYPKQNLNNKFYLHEIIKLEANSDAAVIINNETNVNEEASNSNILTHDANDVKQNSKKYVKKKIDLTKIKEFKEWFDDSKVVNADAFIENYKKDIENFFGKGISPRNGYFDLGSPTSVLADKIKNKNNIVMSEDVLIKATGGKHSISIGEMKKLAEKIQDPLMIFKSDTVKDAYVLFVEMKNNYNIPVVVAIHLNKYNGRSKVINVASVHSRMNTETYKDNTQKFIDTQVEKGNFVHANEKSQSWFTTFGLQLPSVVQTYIDSTNSISQKNDDVNKNSEKRYKKSFEDIEKNSIINNFDYESSPTYENELVRKIQEDKSIVITNKDVSKWRVAQQFNNKLHWYSNYDLTRNLDFIAGKNKILRILLRNEIEKPFYSAKAHFANDIMSKMDNFYNVVVEKYGIKKGSKESEALQWYGEGMRYFYEYETVDGKKQKRLKSGEYTLSQLKKDFPKSWFKIVMADKYCRKIYDEYVDSINDMLREIYPNVELHVRQLENNLELLKQDMNEKLLKAVGDPGLQETIRSQYSETIDAIEERIKQEKQGKRLLKRKDYYHHFMEISDGLKGFSDILNGSFEIDSMLAGVSETTTPHSTWKSFMQERKGQYTEADAVGGMLNYMYAAEYKLHFDPFIFNMRKIIKSIATATQDTKNANSAIIWLTNWTNDICGKTNTNDRQMKDNFGRKAFNYVNRWSDRAKKNAILFNLSSSMVQICNLPNMLAYVKNPEYIFKGGKSYTEFILGKNTEIYKSGFINERYMNNMFNKFDESILKKPEKFAGAMLEFGDRFASQLIWYCAYEQALSEKNSDPVYFADEITRKCVAGRGIGDIPLTQKSLFVKLLMPFQLETNNTFNLIFETLKRKDVLGLIMLFGTFHIFNKFFEKLLGRKVLPDLPKAFEDSVSYYGDGKGNVFSDTLAAGLTFSGRILNFSSYGNAVRTFLGDITTNEQLTHFLGEESSRYGLSNIALTSLFSSVFDFAYGNDIDYMNLVGTFITPYAGKQIEKTVKAAQSYNMLPEIKVSASEGFRLKPTDKNAVYNSDGTVAFELSDSPVEKIKALAFGTSSTKSARDYYNGTEDLDALKKIGITEKDYKKFKSNISALENKSQNNVVSVIDKMDNLSDVQKNALFSSVNKNWKASYFEAKATGPMNEITDFLSNLKEENESDWKKLNRTYERYNDISQAKIFYKKCQESIVREKKRGYNEDSKEIINLRKQQYTYAKRFYDLFSKEMEKYKK